MKYKYYLRDTKSPRKTLGLGPFFTVRPPAESIPLARGGAPPPPPRSNLLILWPGGGGQPMSGQVAFFPTNGRRPNILCDQLLGKGGELHVLDS
jgi:hypothetical protein